MTIQRLTIYSISDITTRKVSVEQKNAFIFPNGTFCLSEGYTGYNPPQPLETKAKEIAEQVLNIYSLKTYYNVQLQRLLENGVKKEVVDSKRFYYLRDILIHYYGYCLFARVQRMDSLPQQEFWDASAIPSSDYFGKKATLEQLQTLQLLFEINQNKTLLPSWNETFIRDSFQKVLTEKNIN